jgi:signal transduction histidine kinase
MDEALSGGAKSRRFLGFSHWHGGCHVGSRGDAAHDPGQPLTATPQAHVAGAEAWRDGWIAIEGVGSAMMVCDARQRLLGASPAARSLFERAGVVIDAADPALPDALFVALRAAIGEQALWRPAPGGRLIGVSRYALGGSLTLLLMREVPERTRIHAGTEPIEHDGQLARRLHEQRLEVTGRLVVTLAHDLRNPLASILLNVEALRQQALGAETRGAVEDIHAAVERVRRAIDALVEFGRLGPPSVSEIALEEIVGRVVGGLRPAMREGRHEVHLDLRGLSVFANPLLLEQILANLLTNAIESCGGGVTVNLRAESDGRQVRLSVADDGPGILPDMRERVFEPFETTRLGRIGLGLTIAREAAESMNGSIVAEETPGGGACLQLTLPAPGRSPR